MKQLYGERFCTEINLYHLLRCVQMNKYFQRYVKLILRYLSLLGTGSCTLLLYHKRLKSLILKAFIYTCTSLFMKLLSSSMYNSIYFFCPEPLIVYSVTVTPLQTDTQGEQNSIPLFVFSDRDFKFFVIIYWYIKYDASIILRTVKLWTLDLLKTVKIARNRNKAGLVYFWSWTLLAEVSYFENKIKLHSIHNHPYIKASIPLSIQTRRK